MAADAAVLDSNESSRIYTSSDARYGYFGKMASDSVLSLLLE